MKVGDLCKVIKKRTHKPCQYGQHVVLLKALNPLDISPHEVIFWETLNQTTGKWHHHHKDDLEVVSCK